MDTPTVPPSPSGGNEPLVFDQLVRLPGLSSARAAIAAMTDRQIRAAFETRVVAGRDEYEHRLASSASLARERFLAWCGR